MTFEQLQIFIAVAEREHLTRAAEALHLTPSAVSSALRKLEDHYNVQLFDRVGRGLSITAEGRLFLDEARAAVGRMRSAENFLGELGGLERGALSLAASQTIANNWLPEVLMRFHARFPGIRTSLTIGNTASVARAVEGGSVEVGYVEGAFESPYLHRRHLTEDTLLVVANPAHRLAGRSDVRTEELVATTGWVLREEGSGTRSAFEDALEKLGYSPASLRIVMEFPSNEAVLSAVRAEGAEDVATVVSGAVAAPWLAVDALRTIDFDLPSRSFALLHHKERHLSKAARAFLELSAPFKDSAGGSRPI
ncbi:LysR family transcriptional regulator [Rhodobacterales bacterium]|nr:LysR family transcriptional regulator [Rhodobacterales bacterium]